MADEIVPGLGQYVTLLSGGSGQVVAIAHGPKGTRYLVRLTGTEIEEPMSNSRFKQVLTPKSQKD